VYFDICNRLDVDRVCDRQIDGQTDRDILLTNATLRHQELYRNSIHMQLKL